MLHFAKIPKKMVKFGENSTNFGQIWANLGFFLEKKSDLRHAVGPGIRVPVVRQAL